MTCLLMKLSSACFLMRWLYYILNPDSLKLVYFAHIYSIVKYGIIFWGKQRDVNKLFILQKRVLRIMIGLSYRGSCRAWFKQLEILTVPCLYTHIYSLLMFVISNLSYFKTNVSVSQYTQWRKIIFTNHWFNLHRYKGAYYLFCH